MPSAPDDAGDLREVSSLLAAAGLKLPADQIAALVAGYRSDRLALERLRAAIGPDDEPAHVVRATLASRTVGPRS